MIKKITNQQSANVYKIYKDGREELYRSANIRDLDQRLLRKIESAISEKQVHNFAGASGTSSYITPAAVLIQDVEIEHDQISSFKAAVPIVESPLKAINDKE